MEQDKEQRPRRHVNWGLMTKGAFAVVFALGCGWVDIQNNVLFGLQESAAIATVFAAAGLGLMVLPFMYNGRYDFQVSGLLIVCGMLSVLAGYMNHMTSQMNHELAELATTQKYNEARKAIEAAEKRYNEAQAEVASIAEQSGSAELQIALDAATKLYDDNKGTCGPVCRDARTKVQTLPDRIGQAKAKELAQKRSAEAWADMQREKSNAPQQAKATMEVAGVKTGKAVLMLILTIIGATCLHRGIEDIKHSITTTPAKPKKPLTLKQASQVAVQAVAEKRNDIAAFIANCTEASDTERTQATPIYDEFCGWWAMYNPGRPIPSSTALGTALGKVYAKSKTEGKQKYHAKIRAWRPAKPAIEKVA